MKIIFAFLFISLASFGQTEDESKLVKYITYRAECIESTGVDKEDVKKFRAGENIDNPKLRDFMLCFAKKAGFVDDENKVHTDVIKTALTEIYGETVTDKMVKACDDKVGATALETSFIMGKCYYENQPT